jgi:hypothetical protein
VRELYALMFAEPGIDPRYLMREMSPAETADYIEGYKRRERSRVGSAYA